MIVDLFYGAGSRYSYLASTQLPSIERRTGCSFRWRPLFSADLMALRGVSPFLGAPNSGQYDWAYRRRDAEEWADFYGVAFREPPDELKVAEVGRRLALACTAAAELGAVEAYSRRLFQAVFVEGRPELTERGLASLAAEAGLECNRFLKLLRDPATHEALQSTTSEAFARGAFGVPTFFTGERMYWGNDRLVLLEHHLRSLRRPSSAPSRKPAHPQDTPSWPS